MMKPLLRNLLVAALGSVPVALLVFLIIQHLSGRNETGSWIGGLGDLVVLYPGVVLPTLIGAVLYSIVLFMAGRGRRGVSRTTALLLTPVVLVPWLLFPIRNLLVYPPLLVGIVCGLVVLGLGVATGPPPATRVAERR
jgi:hypothetical protein